MNSDDELNDIMDQIEDDRQLNDAMDRFLNQAAANYEARERQREFERHLIEQSGGSIQPEEPGRFEFDLERISHDSNRRFGIDERRYRVNIRQAGNVIDRIAPALRDGLQRAIQRLLENRNLPNNHWLYFDIFLERFAGAAYRGNGHHPIRRRLTKTGKPQLQAAYRLHREAGVPEGPVGPDELAMFQAILPEYRLVVIYAGRNDECVAFFPHHPDKKYIIIQHQDNHYNAVTSLKGYHGTSYVYDYCLQGYNDQGKHRCKATQDKFCLCCRQHNCPDFLRCRPQGLKATYKCGRCLRHFYGQTCYENHQKFDIAGKEKPSDCVCFNVRRCKKCGKLLSFQRYQETSLRSCLLSSL